MICEDILKLTEYGMVTGLVPKEDERFTINRLLELFELEELDEDAVAAYQSRTPMSREEAEEISLYGNLVSLSPVAAAVVRHINKVCCISILSACIRRY